MRKYIIQFAHDNPMVEVSCADFEIKEGIITFFDKKDEIICLCKLSDILYIKRI